MFRFEPPLSGTAPARIAYLAIAAAPVLVYVSLLAWFRAADFYDLHFFARGGAVAEYNVMRVAYIACVAWLVYASGVALLALTQGTNVVASLSRIERYTAGFLTGAGLWHLLLFIVGLAGGYRLSVAYALTVPTMILIGPHFAHCIRAAKGDKRPQTPPHKRSVNWGKAIIVVAFVIVCAAFLATKGLYPAGGHDYYTHYFYYYLRVLHNHSILPNAVWYHFYYSKGAGLYFLSMLLTDPMAPQLVATAFIGAGALIVAGILGKAAPGSLLPWIGATLYVAFLIYTPGPRQSMLNGGWGDLEKSHELAGVMLLGVLWATSNLLDTQGVRRRMWRLVLCSSTVALVLITTEMAAFAGAFFVVVCIWAILRRDKALLVDGLVGGLATAATLGGVLAVNYVLTGLPLDQAILYVWPIVNLHKIERWGVLTEVLLLHRALTGELAHKLPLSIHAIPAYLTYLRLEIWWPILAIGSGVAAVAIARGRWREALGSPGLRQAALPIFLFVCAFTLVAVSLGAGTQQKISFYRFSTFNYGPVLCGCLLPWAALRDRPSSLVRSLPTMALLVLALALGWSNWPVMLVTRANAYPYSSQLIGNVRSVMANAGRFLTGRYSLRDAYENQQGWPGRLPWGGIYPPMEKVWKIVGRDVPVYSFHVHSYCMLPDCPVYEFMSMRIVRHLDEVLLGTPEEAARALKEAGWKYFFISNALPIFSPLARAALFSPENIGKYFGVRWTDGTSYLLTWASDDTRPIDEHFLERYRAQIRESSVAMSFPFKQLGEIFAHFKKYGLKPYPLPWCTTCAKMSDR